MNDKQNTDHSTTGVESWKEIYDKNVEELFICPFCKGEFLEKEREYHLSNFPFKLCANY